MSDIPQVQNTPKPKNHQEAQKYQAQNAVVRYYTSIPSLVKDQKDCKISPMVKRIIAEKISEVGNKMGGNFGHNFLNIKGNMDFQDLVKKNWDLEGFCAICLMELDKQEKLFEKRAGNNQASKTKCKDVCDQTRIEIGEMITREIEVNTKWRNIPGNEKKTLEISGRDLLKSVGDQKKKTADKIQIAANTTLFIFGVTNVASGGALALPTAVIPLLRFVGISLFDIHKINIEQLQKQKYKFAESLENKLGSLWSEIENGNLSKKDAKVLEGKLQPFFGLVENRTNLIKILAEIQTCKQNDTKITTDNLKKEDSIFVNICKLSTPTYWNSLKTNLDSKNLSNGWKSKLAWNLAQVVGFGLGEIGVGSYFAHRNPFNYIGKGMQDGWKNVVGNIPNLGTAQDATTSTLGLDSPQEFPVKGNWLSIFGKNIGIHNSFQERLSETTLGQSNDLFTWLHTNKAESNQVLYNNIAELFTQNGIDPNNIDHTKITEEMTKELAQITKNNGKKSLSEGLMNFVNGLEIKGYSNDQLSQTGKIVVAQANQSAQNNIESIGKTARNFLIAVGGFALVGLSGQFFKKDGVEKEGNTSNIVSGVAVVGGVFAGAVSGGIVPAVVGGLGVGVPIALKTLYEAGNKGVKEAKIELQNKNLMNETEVILTEIKPRISSIVNENGKIESLKMFEKILAKVLAQKVYTSGTNEEIKEDLEISLNILANFENEKNNIPENHLGFYKKLATIIKEVLAENSVSTRNIRPPTEIDCGISKQELQDLEIQHLQSEINTLLGDTDLVTELNKLSLNSGENDEMRKFLEIKNLYRTADPDYDYGPFIASDIVSSMNLVVHYCHNDVEASTMSNMKFIKQFLSDSKDIFAQIEVENMIPRAKTEANVEPNSEIDQEEELEPEPEEKLEPKPEKELTKSEAGDLKLKDKLLELRNTKIENFLYKDILRSLQATSLTPLLEKLGFGSYDEYKNFAREIIKQTGKDFNDLLRFIFLSIDENSNSRTLTQFSTSQEKRTSQQLQTQIEITQKAIELIQEKVKELEVKGKNEVQTQQTATQNNDVEAVSPLNPENKEKKELQNRITALLKTVIGTKTLQGKLIETQKDPNKMTKLFVEFDKNRISGSKYFTYLINLFVNFQENTDTINTDLNAQDLEFLLNYFQKEEIESISKLNLVGDIINLPNSNEKIRILEQGNGVDCGICNAINIGQFFGGNIPDKHYDPDINKLKMSYRSRFYTQVRQERGENLNNYWLNQLDGMAILKEILPNNITADFLQGGEFHPKIEEVLVVNGKNRKITKSIYSEKMENARENKQWGIVNKFLLGANFDGTFLEKYIDKYVGFVFRYQENHWNSIVQKNGNWYKIDSLYDPKIEILSESNVYNFLQNHEVHIYLKKK